jgi:hypothetical protein
MISGTDEYSVAVTEEVRSFVLLWLAKMEISC